MHVITRKRLNEFAKLHPNTKSALAQWYTIVKQNDFSSFVELRQLFLPLIKSASLPSLTLAATKFASLPPSTTTERKFISAQS